jgi:hypothetical protein
LSQNVLLGQVVALREQQQTAQDDTAAGHRVEQVLEESRARQFEKDMQEVEAQLAKDEAGQGLRESDRHPIYHRVCIMFRNARERSKMNYYLQRGKLHSPCLPLART